MIHGEVEWLVPGETPSKGSNQIQAEASEILASLAGEGSRKIDAFYLVFENTESADSEVVCSGIDASDGVEYFLGLAGSRDFIRQKMELPPEIQGTSVTFPILASSGYGFHGLPFGQDGTVSQVCAMALVLAEKILLHTSVKLSSSSTSPERGFMG